jgi:hypothetical protein
MGTPLRLSRIHAKKTPSRCPGLLNGTVTPHRTKRLRSSHCIHLPKVSERYDAVVAWQSTPTPSRKDADLRASLLNHCVAEGVELLYEQLIYAD